MADTRRTWAQLATLYADNTAGAISPQDLRDGFASVAPHVAATAPTASADETAGFDTDHAWIDTSTTPNSLYRCLSPATGAAVWAKVYPAEVAGMDAVNVEYDNQTSELAAEDVQAAIDELAVASVPPGGTTGQVLAKASDGDHDTEWVAQTGGGGGIAPADGMVIVVHGGDDGVARPTAGAVLWRGSADPANAVAGDMWDDSEDWD